MDYKPLFDKILVKEITEQKTLGSLLIVQNIFKKGIAVSVGDGRTGSPMTVQEGQTLMFRKEDAADILIEGEIYKLLLERDVWMVKTI